MRAWACEGFGGAEVLRLAACPMPGLSEPTDIRIKIQAIGVNRADILQRQGKYPPPPGASEILGLECAGTVESWGASVTRWKVGDRVMALMSGGAYAEYAVVDERSAMPIPEHWSFEQAAAVPEAFVTAHELILLARVQPSDAVLVHAAASGVGMALLQLLRVLQVSRIIAGVGAAFKQDACLQQGAHGVIFNRSADWTEQVRAHVPYVDVVLDFSGAQRVAEHLDLLAVDGRWVMAALMGGRKGDFDWLPVLQKRLHISGLTLRSQSTDQKSLMVDRLVQRFFHSFDSGALAPVIHHVLPWQKAPQAHALLERNENIGKVVLRVD